ncbi:hypothetical protein HO404_00715 [Streptococcus suis]|uniref:hypothetical protein n=1 Tax=Streptococcus suis TaxID=1307 RepID=UPI000CF5A109|nr:hypothetical protein [Streptococcus suis]NQH34531.1 hypothetical protein [Streptococcus suis]NQH97266.1 hypothetical protein [Streptococcus suis]NQM54361.1 hypothetical protein [Streptococcus suis]NQO47192.1 hypothetical protein [Streptococcus suis]WNF84502.1 hypothetical protein RJW52_00830 [Streptococcus suis]
MKYLPEVVIFSAALLHFISLIVSDVLGIKLASVVTAPYVTFIILLALLLLVLYKDWKEE